ncbi:MAG TPA: hypothetical protein VL284_11675 [Thermoanaerobaculia bacterium]|nr:hypothetical protein [Thermoanaerobaculia bacterium]
MKRVAMLAIFAVLAVSCSSSDYDQGPSGPRGRGGDGGEFAANRPVAGGLDMLPPADWWHQPQIANAVKLTNDQMAALDKIAQDQGNDVSRIETDMTIATRDFRTQLDAPQATTADIVTAGQRIRSLRDSIFDRQLQMLAAERTVLTLDQWQTLQQQLEQQRQQRMQNQGYPRRGGRGFGGGRRGWPGN